MYRRLTLFFVCLAGCAETTAVDSGDFIFVVEPESAFTVGRNALIIELSDTDGRPVAAADLSVHTEMPAHGHGSTEDVEISDLGDGRYRAFPVTLFMPGHWLIGIHAQAGGAQGDFTLGTEVW